MAAKGSDGIEAVGICDPTDPARGHASQAPTNIVFPPQLRFFRDEQPQQSAPHVSKAHNGEVIGRNGLAPQTPRRASATPVAKSPPASVDSRKFRSGRGDMLCFTLKHFGN